MLAIVNLQVRIQSFIFLMQMLNSITKYESKPLSIGLVDHFSFVHFQLLFKIELDFTYLFFNEWLPVEDFLSKLFLWLSHLLLFSKHIVVESLCMFVEK